MNNDAASFGRKAAHAAGPDQLLDLERRTGRSDQFVTIDELVELLLRRSLSGKEVAVLSSEDWRFSLTIPGLDATARVVLEEEFLLEKQQARGAWFLPEAATLDVGWANFPFHFLNEPRFATGITTAERGKVSFHDSVDALFFWSVLESLFERLYFPFALRGPLAGTKDRDWQRNAWLETEAFLDALGFDVRGALAPIRYGGGWSRLKAHEQMQAKQLFMQTLQHQAQPSTGSRFRAYQIQRLLSRYYRQAKKDPPKLRQVLTVDLKPVLAAFFGGDWLAFLAYIGEEPHPDERIATALPETRLVVSDPGRIAAVAAAQGLPTAEVERALAAFWGSDTPSSPIDDRIEILRHFWREFDTIHSLQTPGMPPLWGLLQDGRISLFDRPPYHASLYRLLLSAGLLARIDQLWSTSVLSRWPERLVTTIAPHALLAETFGPALQFWHGCALTAWFICEGPYSRTDLQGLADYYARETRKLADLECPVDPTLFAELRQAENQLGYPRRIQNRADPNDHVIVNGFHLTLEITNGSRRTGFEVLRDIISRHRIAWSERYLDVYLRSRWEAEIRDAARDFHMHSEQKGKAPNPKQFAPHASLSANHWFNGDISGVYRMIGEKSSVQPKPHRLLPDDRHAFVHAVFNQLVGNSRLSTLESNTGTYRDEYEARSGRWNLEWLAEESPRFVQYEEALGRPPKKNEFGRDAFDRRASILSPDADVAWSMYQEGVRAARYSLASSLNEPDLPAQPSIPSTLSGDVTASVPNVPSERTPFWRKLLRG